MTSNASALIGALTASSWSSLMRSLSSLYAFLHEVSLIPSCVDLNFQATILLVYNFSTYLFFYFTVY